VTTEDDAPNKPCLPHRITEKGTAMKVGKKEISTRVGVVAVAICALVLTVSACGGGADQPSSSDAASTGKTANGGGDFTAEPAQLGADPCTLVTSSEAAAVVGAVNETPGLGTDKHTCVYVSAEHTGGQIAVTEQSPDFCKLLFLALDQDMFGGAQVRIDDIASGGMLVKGNGNVQVVVNGGCLEVDGRMTYDKKVDDDTMLRLAKTAAGRVS
jgi:hypothetical protein